MAHDISRAVRNLLRRAALSIALGPCQPGIRPRPGSMPLVYPNFTRTGVALCTPAFVFSCTRSVPE